LADSTKRCPICAKKNLPPDQFCKYGKTYKCCNECRVKAAQKSAKLYQASPEELCPCGKTVRKINMRVHVKGVRHLRKLADLNVPESGSPDDPSAA
jgi:hypothetical protein